MTKTLDNFREMMQRLNRLQAKIEIWHFELHGTIHNVMSARIDELVSDINSDLVDSKLLQGDE